jgi:hypothetical protein
MSYPAENKIMPTGKRGEFFLHYTPPPPPPLDIFITLNKKEPFTEEDISNIMNALHHLIYRPDRKFVKQYEGKTRTLNIQVIKNFHYDMDNYCPTDPKTHTEHINIKFITDSEEKGICFHAYFTRNRKAIISMSQISYTQYNFI